MTLLRIERVCISDEKSRKNQRFLKKKLKWDCEVRSEQKKIKKKVFFILAFEVIVQTPVMSVFDIALFFHFLSTVCYS